MIRAFQYPADAPSRLMLQMLQKPLMKTVCVEMADAIQPASITRNGIGRIEAETSEDVRVDLGAFLWRVDRNRVHLTEAGRQHFENPKLASYPAPASILPRASPHRRIWVYQLPYARHSIRRIRGQQLV